jgi:hypothetical protein
MPNLSYNKLHGSGVYKISCKECGKLCTGQTGSSFKIRYNEHLRAFIHGISKSHFAQHVLDYGHSFDRMEDIMNASHLSRIRSHFNTMEKFYIYKETKMDNQLNDNSTMSYNNIF